MTLSLTPVAPRNAARPSLTLACAAAASALLDGLTTALSLAHGGIELNPLIGALPDTGLLAALTLCKMLAAFVALGTPAMFRVTFLTGAIAVWGGVSVNNILVATILPDPVPLIGGTLASLCLLAWAARGPRPINRSAAS